MSIYAHKFLIHQRKTYLRIVIKKSKSRGSITKIATFMIIDPLILNEFIIKNKEILRPKFPEPKKSGKVGRPRIAKFWVLAAVCVFSRANNITWEDLPPKLRLCNFLIDDGYFIEIPSKSTFHRAWQKINLKNIESWIKLLGYQSSKELESLTVDSSGFEKRTGSNWRFVKWQGSFLKKSSNLFQKIHMAVALPSRAIVGIHISNVNMFDSKAFGPLILKTYKRVLKKCKKLYADKAYWDEKILGWCYQEGITPVIPCKKNSKINGIHDFMDHQVRYQKRHPGIYRKNTQNYKRAEVEHVFGEIKLQHVIIRDLKKDNKEKSLLSSFLWYNHKNYLRRLK